MSDDELDIEYIDDIVGKVAEHLKTCATALLSCEEENKKCKKCKDRENCLIFIRSVLAALCKMEIARMEIPDKNISESMYV